MNPERKQWTAEELQGLVRGFQLPLVVAALVRTGVLERLVSGRATIPNLASRCGLDASALARLLNALVAVGILEHSGDVYALPAELEQGLSGDIGSRLDGIKHSADGLDKWMGLEEALKRGSATYPDALDVTLEPERNERFIRAMHSHAGPMARRFAGLIPRQGASRFLDVGGGPGTFCFALLEAWPDLEATVADLPLTLRVTRQLVAEKGLGDRMKLIEADFYRDAGCELGGPYDLVLVSAVIHAEGEDENRDLLHRLRGVVATGGRIVVRERLLDEDRTGPPAAAMFDVHMLVSTRRGRCYTRSQISAMLTDAGFSDPRLLSSHDEGFLVADA